MTELLLQTVDLNTGGVTAEQTALAASLLALFALALIIGSYLLQFVNLPDEQKRQKKALLGQRESQTGATLRVRAGDDIPAIRSDIRSLFDGDQPDVEEASLRTAAAAVRQELGGTWGSYASAIPRLARWLLELAAGVALAAALATVSVETYQRLFTAGGGGFPTFDELLADAGWALGEFAATSSNVLGAFPYADLIWALTFAYSVQFATWLYDHPIVVIAVLVLSAVGIILLDRRAPEARDVRVTARFSVWSLVVGGVVVWVAGATPAAIGGALGIPQIGAIVGLLLAGLVALGLAYLMGKALVADTKALVRVANDPDRPAIAYLIVRRVGAAAASLAAPLIPVYLIAAVVSGQVTGIIGAFLAGSLTVQLAFGLLVVASLLALVWLARASVAEVRGALSNLSADTAVRLALFRRGVPIVVMATVYLLALGFGLPWFAGIALSLAAGIAARGAYALFRRVRYRISQHESEQSTPRQVQIRAHRLETADGDTRYYADINAVQLAHEDPEALTDAVCAVIDDLFERGETDPRIERAFAEDLLRYGIVDVDETQRKLVKKAEEEAEGRMPHDVETLEERVLERIPEPVWQQTKREKMIHGEWSKRDGRLTTTG